MTAADTQARTTAAFVGLIFCGLISTVAPFVTALGRLVGCLSSPLLRSLLFFLCGVRAPPLHMERRSPAPSPAPSPPASFSAGVSYSVGTSFMSSYERSPHYNFANPGRSVLRAYLLFVAARCDSNARLQRRRSKHSPQQRLRHMGP